MNIQTITLDISKRSAVTPVLYLRQGDKSGTQLRVNVMRDGAAFPLSGYGVRFEMRAPKDKGYYECTGGASGNVATFTIDETYAAAFAGTTDTAYIRILEGSNVVASAGNFRVVILEDGTEGVDPNGAYTNGVTEWLEDATEQLNDVSGRAEAAIEAIGDISELAVPLMSTDVRGGAKLGHGLRISAERLGVQLVDGASGEASVGADGDYLHALAVHGKSVQDGTPTPDNPIEVRTVKGINLFDGVIESGVYNNTNGEKISSGNYARNTNRVPVTGGATYTINMKRANSNSGLYLYKFGADGSYLGTMPGSLTLPYTFTVAQDVAYICFGIGGSTSVETPSTISEVQLELGTKAGPYIPYGALGLKVTGKNRLDVSGYTDRWNYGITYENTSDGIKVYGKSTDTSFNITGLAQAGLSRLEPGTYTLSWEDVDNAGIAAALRDGSANTILNYGASGRSFTVGSTTDVYIIFYIPNNKTVDGVFRPQIEKGTAATEYAPCVDSVVPIPLNGNALASLPYGTCDVLAIDDAGHAVIEKKVETAAYSGDSGESWTSITSGLRVAITRQGIKRSAAAAAVANAACSHFTASSMNATSAGTIGLAVNSAADQIVITPTGETITVADWTAWLQSNPITLLYQLATPQTIDLGYIDMPRLTEGSTIELLATIDPPIDAEWWAVGAGAVHEAVAAQSERIAALESAIAELATS